MKSGHAERMDAVGRDGEPEEEQQAEEDGSAQKESDTGQLRQRGAGSGAAVRSLRGRAILEGRVS